ncbi:tRNA uridine-5-carboxymethylaminomethyl(34) synthesis GTPase MnmE [Synechococcus sp. CBW1004]|nr:tRNA uridine-5-carboxymethylaminomethyl(34) synthesis GTPase MnmE [Synechococcus sp. CBW1004]
MAVSDPSGRAPTPPHASPGAQAEGDTIAAIATAVAAGAGSVAIVRLSGPAAEAIGRRLFQAPGTQVWDSHRVLYGHVVDPISGERVDEALLLVMRAPRSFTREDVVELHCHGGLEAVRRVLELVLSAGARRARPGEFSQRAFLNGRLDLTRAEALAALIDARGRRAAQLAMAGLDGGVQRRISALRDRLLDQLAELEARVDFEEDLPPLDSNAVVAELSAVKAELERLVAEGQHGELLRQGLRVAIVGRPNVGKSSLLNLLSRRDRAIVTDLPGTTRDLLESELVLDGVPLTLIDTAGIRATDDPVERLGIARSHQALAAADVVLLLYDLAAGWTDADAQLRALVPDGVPLLLVGNKADLLEAGGDAGEIAMQPATGSSTASASPESIAVPAPAASGQQGDPPTTLPGSDGQSATFAEPRPGSTGALEASMRTTISDAALAGPGEAAATDPASPGEAALVQISALRGDGRERLASALLRLCGAGDLQGLQVALNTRQRDLAAHAATALAASQAAAAEQLPWDFWTIDLREAVRRLGEITGEEVSEAVLDRVFSRFCIGK